MSGNREPVRTYADLSSLDDGEIVEGYFDGLRDEPCGDNRSRSYWHGWRNGRVDKGYAKVDADQRALASDVAMLERMAGHA